MEQNGTENGKEGASDMQDATSAEARLNKKLEDIAPETPASAESAATSAVESDAKSEVPGRGDVSAATLARMMGLATATEVSLLEGKIDLLSTRVNSVTVRLDKILNAVSKLPNANDVDRIDINIGSLKTMIRETVDKLGNLSEIGTEGDKNLENVKIMASGTFDSPEEEEVE